MQEILTWIKHNRFTVVLPVIGLIVWITAIGCEPFTISPVSGKEVNVTQLQIEYDATLAKFDAAVEDIERKYEQQEAILQAITQLATGDIVDMQGAISLLIGAGGVGVLFDNRRNRRKDTVIAAMKKRKK